MAQANSVQREPSMEEILASIRRIIEDSDTARKVLDDEEDARSADVAPESHPITEIDAFREELTAEGPAEPVSLAEIQAEVAYDAEADPEPAREAWPPPLSHMREEESEASRYEEQPNYDYDAIEDVAETAVHGENQNPKPAILSDHAGRQVAASFGELSEAFAASRRQSFDEMAEDMMRPMLQDWLDNNLPLLVEKLVREEIERVARGGTR